MSTSLDALTPELRPFARALVDAAGVAELAPRVTSTRRSTFDQTRLYLSYLRGVHPYPVAFPGTSAHEFGEAFDMLVTPYDALADVGAFWQEMRGGWGGARDPIHFELPGASQAHPITFERVQAFYKKYGLYSGQAEAYGTTCILVKGQGYVCTPGPTP